MSKKRKTPKERFMPVTKKMEIAASEALLLFPWPMLKMTV